MLAVLIIVNFLDLFEVKKQTNKKTKRIKTTTLFSFLTPLAYLSKGFMREVLCRNSFQNILLSFIVGQKRAG